MTVTLTSPPRPETLQPATEPQQAPRLAFRPDIEGLRAVAVLLVVAFHAQWSLFGGGYVGVDVFFVISGFLITSLLVAEFGRAGRVSLQDFYARRARRILPAACVVIVVSAIAVILLLNPLVAYRSLGDLGAAALYVSNVRFIRANLDYLAASTDHSVALHFWSLSVEEQFYLIWPLLIVVTLTLGAGIRRARWCLGVVLGIATLSSFIAGVVLTVSDPALAYMATFTRAWQFGVGALLGIVALYHPGTGQVTTARRHFRRLLGWAGLAAVLLSAIAFTSSTPFPGTAALLPTVGAAAVIAAGVGPRIRGAVGSMLQLRPARWLGKISYSLYLWHWPVFVLLGGNAAPSLLLSVGLVLLSILLAAATYYLVERPFIKARSLTASRLRSGAVTASVVALSVAVLGALGANLHRTLGEETNPGGFSAAQFTEIFASGKHLKSGPVEPAPLKASADKPSPGECLSFRSTEQAPNCVFGPVDGTPVVLFGDSHANQWMTPFQKIADQHGWRLTVFTQGSCPVQDFGVNADLGYAGEEACVQWRADRIKAIRALAPKYVIVGSLNRYKSTPEQWASAWRKSLVQLEASGAKIIYIYDTPNPEMDVPGCVSGATDDWDKCVFPLRDQQLEAVAREDKLIRDNKIKYVIDVNKYLCPEDLCYAVRNGILLYRDNSHLTNTAASLLQVPIVDQLQEQGVL